jgi:hypothetical protein
MTAQRTQLSLRNAFECSASTKIDLRIQKPRDSVSIFKCLNSRQTKTLKMRLNGNKYAEMASGPTAQNRD